MALIYLGLDEWKYRKSSLEEEVEAKQVGDVLTGAALSRVMAKPVRSIILFMFRALYFSDPPPVFLLVDNGGSTDRKESI